jgi:hypothetical protein
MQAKPDDRWSVPLKHDHHVAQHDHGSELEWWEKHGKDPFTLAIRYFDTYTAERAAAGLAEPVQRPSAKVPRKAKPRPKRHRRQPGGLTAPKIPSKPFPKGHRPLKG